MGTVTVKLDLSKTGFSAGITDARRQARQLGDSLKEIGHTGVSSMQAASASIRVLEGGMTGNIRAAERFISLIPGIGKALQTAFPAVGAIALAGVFVRIGEEAAKAIHQVEQMRNVAREGFLSMTESAMKSADSLRVTNDKLEQQIALLEHKPVNTVALALDEARERADDLAISLNKDYTEFKKITDAAQGNVFQRILGGVLGKGSTSEVSGGLQDRFANISTLGLQAQTQTRAGDTAGAAATSAQLRAAQEEMLQWSRAQVAMRQGRQQYQPDGTIAYAKSFSGPSTTYAGAHGDQGVNIDALQSAQGVVMSQEDTADQSKRNISDQARVKQLEDASKASEAAKKAQQMLLEVDEEQLKQQDAFNKLSINETIQFWMTKAAAFTKGGQQYIEVQDKIYDLIAKRPDLSSENKKNQAESGKSAVEGNDILGNAQRALITTPATEQMERAAKSLEKYNEMVAQSASLKTREAQAFRESSIAIALEQGTLSKLAAAQQLAKVHADEHAAALRDVNKALADQLSLINDPSTKMTPDDRANAARNAKQEAGNQADQVNGVYAVTQQQDAANIYRNTSSGEAADSWRTMLQNWSNMTANISAAMTKAADSFNDDIAKAVAGHGSKKDFGKTFSNLGESLVKASLQRSESSLFGGGQLGATPNNPVWTRNAANAVGTPGGPNLGPFIRPFVAGQQGQGNGQSQGQQGGQQGGQGSIWGQLLHSFLPGLFKGGQQGGAGDGSGGDSGDGIGDSDGGDGAFQGGFSGGGDVVANRPMLVGEQGPEILTPRTAGRVIPNSQLGGGSTGHTFNIDARGATDPAAVHAAVMRAAPHIIAASVQAQHHAAKRSPSGR